MSDRVPELCFEDYANGDAQRRAQFGHDLLWGLQRFGFITLRAHPIRTALLEKAYALSAGFFAQPEVIKREYVGSTRGYIPFRTERAKNRTVPDLKEFWQIGPEGTPGTARSSEAPNVWPASPPGFKSVFVELFAALQETGRIILEALAPGLGLPHTYFGPLIAEGNSVLRLLHYPPIPE